MVTCADTSFLFSIYGNDAHTPRAIRLGAGRFLTFDGNQKKLALAEGLGVPL